MSKRNLSEIIHDLKLSYSRTFHKKYEYSPQLEEIINASAYRIKEGEIGRWIDIKGVKIIKF